MLLQLLPQILRFSELIGCNDENIFREKNGDDDPSKLVDESGVAPVLRRDVEMEDGIDAGAEGDDARPDDVDAAPDDGGDYPRCCRNIGERRRVPVLLSNDSLDVLCRLATCQSRS